MIGRDEDRLPAGLLEIVRRGWRKFVMRLRIHIIKVAINPELIVAHLGFESRIPAPPLLLGERTREGVKIKATQNVTGIKRPPHAVLVVDIIGSRT